MDIKEMSFEELLKKTRARHCSCGEMREIENELLTRFASPEEKIKDLSAYKEDIENATKGAMDETCVTEKHCSCVPLLRAKIKGLEEENRLNTNRIVEDNAIFDSIELIINEGEEPCDFLMSYPIVRNIFDAYRLITDLTEQLAEAKKEAELVDIIKNTCINEIVYGRSNGTLRISLIMPLIEEYEQSGQEGRNG